MRPHFYCLIDPLIAEAFTVCHILIATAYAVISAAIVIFAWRRGYSFLPRRWLDGAFAVFIVGCGGTHAAAAYTMWYGSPPTYMAELAILVVTMLASIVTMFAMISVREELARPPADELRRQMR